MAKNTGDDSRKGAVKKRSQVENTATGKATKRDTTTGEFIDQKTDDTKFKGVRQEKLKAAATAKPKAAATAKPKATATAKPKTAAAPKAAATAAAKPAAKAASKSKAKS